MKRISSKLIVKLLQLRPQVPAGKSGDVEITHRYTEVGEPVTVVSVRNSLMMGYKPLKIRFDVPILIRSLSQESEGTWMSDQPQELWQQDMAAKRLRGNVLIGGLGLGVASEFARLNPKVTDVTTVEIKRDIFALVSPHS